MSEPITLTIYPPLGEVELDLTPMEPTPVDWTTLYIPTEPPVPMVDGRPVKITGLSFSTGGPTRLNDCHITRMGFPDGSWIDIQDGEVIGEGSA